MKIDRVLLYKIIAGISFIVLCLTQLLHIRNMYAVESEKYYAEEKRILGSEYIKSIVNDKLFPGANKIIDSFIYRHIDSLEILTRTNQSHYTAYSKKIYDSLFCSLKKANNMDSLLQVYIKRNKVSRELEYALVMQSIDIAFQPNRYIPFFDKSIKQDPSEKDYVENVGAIIGGSLTTINKENEVSGIIVSSPLARSYRTKFSFHCDSPDRLQQILLKMLPTLLVSFFSILTVLLIFLYTLINWQKQKKMSELKSDFINTITHEFQTPLTAIMIANRTIENENRIINNDKLSFLNNIITRQTERLNVLVKQVAETGKEHNVQLDLQIYHLNDLINEILADYQFNVQDQNVVINFDERAKNDSVSLDKIHFTSIIINLLDNAVKYNHKAEKIINISTATISEKTLQFSISDNGEGMSEKVRKNMFERFYRDPSLTRTNEPGLGLGLYFARQSMDAHHWKFEVKSKEGEGTVFLIYIPLKA